jgi:hypothetical protein
VHGIINADGQDIPLANATLTGDHLRFTATMGDRVKMSLNGWGNGEAMRGSVDVQGGAMAGRYNWRLQCDSTSVSSAPPH